MPSTERLRLIGGTGSPYTRKMLALLRYRHIPYAITWADPGTKLDEWAIEKPRPTFLPTFLFDDGDGGVKATCDSTPIIRRLEDMYSGRSVLPVDPALAFIDYLIEDFGDEWCTKYMFHYRWYPEADADNAGTLLPYGMGVSLPAEMHKPFKDHFSKRQIDRLYVVGSNDTTAPVIDASYRRFLTAMENHLSQQPFMLGNRPGAGDYALYGQLTQLVGFDPTPRAITHEVSPRTVAWVDLMEDQCGLNPLDSDWNTLEDAPDTLKEVLAEIGRVYVPALLANAKSVQAGEKTWDSEIDGKPWTQQTFPYQAKCLNWINEQYRALSSADKARVDTVLAGTGCEAVLIGE
ncbi:MAG: glutathione S-transferase [Halioglobus sp.]|jgi:glutathione S-transferase